jgi:hypothetical protein
MSDTELEYYQHRAEEEIELARHSSDSRAVQAHYEIAAAYLDRIHGEQPKAPPGLLEG